MIRFGIILVAGLFLLPDLTYSQAPAYTTISGIVTNDSTGAPISGAHVFIASSMIGSVTAETGHYRLDGVPTGAHRLYVSIIGYEPVSKDVMLHGEGPHIFDFKLKPTVVQLEEVTVEAKLDKKWQRRFEKFTRLFIGETPNAEQTKIVNPEVLDFEDNLARFTARASETLIIENHALGYRIQYFLKEFGATPGRTWYDGEPLFEEMEPESEEQAALWEENRRKAFMGSFRHFLLALLAGRVEEQGFLTYSRPAFNLSPAGSSTPVGPTPTGSFSGKYRFPVEPEELFTDGSNPSEKILDFHGAVEIIYRGEKEDPSYSKWLRNYARTGRIEVGKGDLQTSWIQLEKGPTVFDYKGDVLDPYGVTFMGYLAFERVADEIPKEYRPGR